MVDSVGGRDRGFNGSLMQNWVLEKLLTYSKHPILIYSNVGKSTKITDIELLTFTHTAAAE